IVIRRSPRIPARCRWKYIFGSLFSTMAWKRTKNTSSVSRRWHMTSFAAQFFGSGRRDRTASLCSYIAAASSSGVRAMRASRASNGCFAYSSTVSISLLLDGTLQIRTAQVIELVSQQHDGIYASRQHAHTAVVDADRRGEYGYETQ